jgi:TonB family protein
MKKPLALWFVFLLAAFTLPGVFVRGQDATEPTRKIVNKVIPRYPALARTMNIEGTVRADVLVAPDGKVKTIEFKGGHPLLVQSAEQALREWRWEPAAHESHESVELRFKP